MGNRLWAPPVQEGVHFCCNRFPPPSSPPGRAEKAKGDFWSSSGPSSSLVMKTQRLSLQLLEFRGWEYTGPAAWPCCPGEGSAPTEHRGVLKGSFSSEPNYLEPHPESLAFGKGLS